MKVALLGAKCLPSAAPIDHTVVPFVGAPDASAHVNAVPPHAWTSIPRCCLYQARSATGSLARKKIPPIPVTLFILASEVQSGWNVLPGAGAAARLWIWILSQVLRIVCEVQECRCGVHGKERRQARTALDRA